MSVQIYLLLLVLLCIIVVSVSSVTTIKITKKDYYDKVKLDIELEQMIESERKIDLFLHENDIRPGVSIKRIAEILNVKEGGVDHEILSQACLKENCFTGEKVVVFKEELSEQDKNFVFAHEIAHILNGDSIPVTRPVGRNKSQTEQLADYTAAALLMPIDHVFDFLQKNHYMEASAKKRMAFVRQLCKDYMVNEMIVLRRIKEIYAIKQVR